MTDAQDLLHRCHPDMLESVTHPNLDVVVFFHCLHYIELIRWDPYLGFPDLAVNPIFCVMDGDSGAQDSTC